MKIESNDGRRITSVAEWRELAPPAAPHHWRPYRSAYELAWAWIEGDARQRLTELLPGDVTLERAIAERKTRFDDIPRGPRNHDLLVVGRNAAGPLVVGIEAKADESFDLDLAGYRAVRLLKSPHSRAPERLDRLERAFFGAVDPSLDSLRYQLFSALAGTLADARTFGAKTAALVVHEFVTPLIDPDKQATNAADLEAFLRRFGDVPRATAPNGAWLAGPFTVPGNRHLPGDVPIYVGKLRTHVARRSMTATRA